MEVGSFLFLPLDVSDGDSRMQTVTDTFTLSDTTTHIGAEDSFFKFDDTTMKLSSANDAKLHGGMDLKYNDSDYGVPLAI